MSCILLCIKCISRSLPQLRNAPLSVSSPECAPSHLGVIGHYVLTSQIFELLESTTPGSGEKIQLTDAIAHPLKMESVFATTFSGKRYDCGNKLGYLHATIQYALKHPDVSEDFVTLLRNLKV
jgi:UTP--glucose-1-phosphate uridylyltransferase